MSNPKPKPRRGASAVEVGSAVMDSLEGGLLFDNTPFARWSIDKLLAKLDYTVETVLEAAVEQARGFESAAFYRVDKMRIRMSREMELDRLKADADLLIRKNAEQLDEKVTEAAIKARIVLNPLVRRAADDLARAETDEEYSKLLLEAYRHRRDSLEVVGQQSGAERALAKMVQEGTDQDLAATRQRLRQKYSES